MYLCCVVFCVNDGFPFEALERLATAMVRQQVYIVPKMYPSWSAMPYESRLILPSILPLP